MSPLNRLPAELVLVLGGARSGKSQFAESLVLAYGGAPIYLATAETPTDPEMLKRIQLHRNRRDVKWHTVEIPLNLSRQLPRLARNDHPVLLDCITLWLSNVYAAEEDPLAAINDLTNALKTISSPVVIVSNELGGGTVPEHPLTRDFRDTHGTMNMKVASIAHKVFLVTAGIPMQIK